MMTDDQTMTRDVRRVMMINTFTLSLTLALVILGFTVSQPAGVIRTTSLGLLVFSVLFNVISLSVIRRGGGRLIRWARIYLNLVINIFLVFLLGHYFSTMWLILAIPPVSSAIYGTRRQTVVSLSQNVAALLIIGIIHGIHTPLEGGELAARILFMVVVSLLINQSIRTGEPTTGLR